MIDLYTWTTPNGRKASIMLEETGLDYTVHPVDLGKGEQHAPTFLTISPNNKIPAIVDHDGPDGSPISVFESGAILIYLAEKTGRLLPKTGPERVAVMEWLMFQMGGIGPFMGQAFHFTNAAPVDIPYARERYDAEMRRLLGVMNRRLADADHLAGDYSIADVASYPWIARAPALGIDMPRDFPRVQRWLDAVGDRPAVTRGMVVPAI
jgi:GST-like protein